MQHVSDLHLKFALTPHHVWQSATAEIRRGKKKEDRTNYRAKILCLHLLPRAAINNDFYTEHADGCSLLLHCTAPIIFTKTPVLRNEKYGN